MENRCNNCPLSKNVRCTCYDLNLYPFSREEIEEDIIQAMNLVFINERDLLKRDIHERTISFYLTHYFISLFSEKYKGYHIDPEYNRNGNDSKYYYEIGSKNILRAIPDIIIHKRNCNKYNLLYLELKKYNHDNRDCDKIKKFVADKIDAPCSESIKPTIYKFRHGVSVVVSYNKVTLRWYVKEKDTWIQNDYRFENNQLEKVCSIILEIV